MTVHTNKNVSPQEALEELIAGNERYINDLSIHFEENAIKRQHTAIHGQFPIAAVLACSDSRLPIETLLDQGNGDIFAIRVAGNIVGSQVLGSIDYSITVLNVPLVLVLGHTNCGAIGSAVDRVYAEQGFTRNVKDLLQPLLPLAYEECRCHPNPTSEELADLKEHLAVQNVWKSIEEIIESSEVTKQRIADNSLMVVGAIYDIQTGEVDWLGTNKEESLF